MYGFKSRLACAGLCSCLMMGTVITLTTTETVKASKEIGESLAKQPNQRVLALLIHSALRDWKSAKIKAEIESVLPDYMAKTPKFNEDYDKFAYLMYNTDRQNLTLQLLTLIKLVRKQEQPEYIGGEALKFLKPGITVPGDSKSHAQLVAGAASLLEGLSLSDQDIDDAITAINKNWKQVTEED